MKSICYVVAIPLTIRAFFIPQLLRMSEEFRVTVICSKDDELQSILGNRIQYIPVEIPRGIAVKRTFDAILKLQEIFRREKFDLVQYSTPNAAFCASLAARCVGIKVRNYHCMGFRYLGFEGVKKILFRMIEKVTCSLSTHIECVSESNRKLGVSEGLFREEKAVVVHYGSTGGIDMQRFNYEKRDAYRSKQRKECGYSNSDVVFGFVGRITRDKGINELFQAFQNLSIEYKNIKLALIGKLENDDLGVDEKWLTEIKRNQDIQLLGSKVNVEAYYPMMDVLVLPSYREGFGNVVIEAESMGVPVIVTAIPGPLDTMIPNETGLCCNVKDIEDLKRKMEILIKDYDLRVKMGVNAYQYVRRCFDSTVLNEKILDQKRYLMEN